MARELQSESRARNAPGAGERSRDSGGIDIPQDLQAEIREFARALPDMNYYQILGLAAGASAAEIRDGFFERSKRFHPDRYFRKNLGVYGGLLHEIYKRVAAAHDVLRDRVLREQYDQGLGFETPAEALPPAPEPPSAPPPVSAASPSSPASAASAASAAPEPPRFPEARAYIEAEPPTDTTVTISRRSLRTRRGLRPPGSSLRALERQLDAGRRRAPALFERAQALAGRGEWEEAAKVLRLAVALDPHDEEYRATLAELAPRARESRVERALAGAAQLLAGGDGLAALAELEEAAELRPADHALAARVAELAASHPGEGERALRFARRACELAPDEAGNRLRLERLLGTAASAPRDAGEGR
jgi:curved DNA-binding protein CbpA